MLPSFEKSRKITPTRYNLGENMYPFIMGVHKICMKVIVFKGEDIKYILLILT